MQILIIDAAAYLGDVSQGQWQALHDSGASVYGAILKCSEGTTYGGGEWFRTQWKRVRDVDGYARTWFRGVYHYLKIGEDGAKQAEFCFNVIKRAGGFARGDMRLFLDIERASNPALLDADQVIATTYAFTRRWLQLAGHRPVLYARGLTRDLGIHSMMGCEGEWDASYTATMATSGLVGGVGNVVLWQYAGRNSAGGIEGDDSVHGLPLTIEGFPPNHDVSVYVDGANVPSLESFKRRLLTRLFDPALVALFVGVVLAGHYGGGTWPS